MSGKTLTIRQPGLGHSARFSGQGYNKCQCLLFSTMVRLARSGCSLRSLPSLGLVMIGTLLVGMMIATTCLIDPRGQAEGGSRGDAMHMLATPRGVKKGGLVPPSKDGWKGAKGICANLARLRCILHDNMAPTSKRQPGDYRHAPRLMEHPLDRFVSKVVALGKPGKRAKAKANRRAQPRWR